MSGKTTRHRIKYQVNQALNNIEKIYEHLRVIELEADGRSPIIDNDLPLVVQGLKMFEDVLFEFYEKL